MEDLTLKQWGIKMKLYKAPQDDWYCAVALRLIGKENALLGEDEMDVTSALL